MVRPPDLPDEVTPRQHGSYDVPALDGAGTAARTRRAVWQPWRRPTSMTTIIIAIAVVLVLATVASYVASRLTEPRVQEFPAAIPTFTPASPTLPPASPTPTAPAPPPRPAPTSIVPAPQPEAPSSDAAEALAALELIPAEPDIWTPDYNRDLFGQRWADVDRNGCDTRNDILARDLDDVTFKPGTNNCKVRTGTLLDPYDGSTTKFVSGQHTSVLVQIDHVVPLAWAWHRGAYAWTDAQRLQFANDPMNLRATTEAMNQAKKASGPAEWLPPNKDLQCSYAITWVEVLTQYQLGINKAERNTTRELLLDCPG